MQLTIEYSILTIKLLIIDIQQLKMKEQFDTQQLKNNQQLNFVYSIDSVQNEDDNFEFLFFSFWLELSLHAWRRIFKM